MSNSYYIQFAGYQPWKFTLPLQNAIDNPFGLVDLREANEILADAVMGDVNDDGWIDVIAGNESFQLRPVNEEPTP